MQVLYKLYCRAGGSQRDNDQRNYNVELGGNYM